MVVFPIALQQKMPVPHPPSGNQAEQAILA